MSPDPRGERLGPRTGDGEEEASSGEERAEAPSRVLVDVLRMIFGNAKFRAAIAKLPAEARSEIRMVRKHLVRELRRFNQWPVRRGVLREDHARIVAVFLGELQRGSSLVGVNLFKGQIAGGQLFGCNAALADVREGNVGIVNVLAGAVHGGTVRAVSLIAADVFGGDIDHCAVLVGNVFGGRARVGLLVGDVLGGEVSAGRHVGTRYV
jgi:hypothetical protein